jgi:DnaJ-domain-containing protein 1
MVERRPAAIVMANKLMFAIAVVCTIVLGTQAQAQAPEVQPMPPQLCDMAQSLQIEKQCGTEDNIVFLNDTRPDPKAPIRPATPPPVEGRNVFLGGPSARVMPPAAPFLGSPSAKITPPMTPVVEYRAPVLDYRTHSNHGGDVILHLLGVVLWSVILGGLFKSFKGIGVFAFAGPKAQGATEREYERERQREAQRQGQADHEQETERRRREETRRAEERQREAERQRQAEERRQAERDRQAETEREAERQRRQREREQPTKQNWWEVLGVSPNASRSEITRAYRRKIQQYHPDRVSGLVLRVIQTEGITF